MGVCQILSCQTHSIKLGAEKIRILDSEPKGCLFMGEVSAVQDNEDVAMSGGEPEMTLNTRIELRNKAFVQSANVLVFTPKSKAKVASVIPPVAEISKKDKASDAKDAKPVDVPMPTMKPAEAGVKPPAESVFLGTVFRCPPLIFNQ